MRGGGVRHMDHGVFEAVAIERFTTGARHQRARLLRRQPLSFLPHRIFALGLIPLIAPGLDVNLPLSRYSSQGGPVSAINARGFRRNQSGVLSLVWALVNSGDR
jgi:hypothetical protein